VPRRRGRAPAALPPALDAVQARNSYSYGEPQSSPGRSLMNVSRVRE
jgi:hypothetical protein